MKWADLCDNAKNVIEWIENPYTGKRETVSIRVGEQFIRDCCGTGDVSILITKELFEEIRSFVIADLNIQASYISGGNLTFAIKPESKVQLH